MRRWQSEEAIEPWAGYGGGNFLGKQAGNLAEVDNIGPYRDPGTRDAAIDREYPQREILYREVGMSAGIWNPASQFGVMRVIEGSHGSIALANPCQAES